MRTKRAICSATAERCRCRRRERSRTGGSRAIPLEVDLALVKRGRNRFEIFCATCHGIAGDAKSVVADQMDLVKPRSLVEAPVLGYPAGRIFRVAREGFGLMPSYRGAISTGD